MSHEPSREWEDDGEKDFYRQGRGSVGVLEAKNWHCKAEGSLEYQGIWSVLTRNATHQHMQGAPRAVEIADGIPEIWPRLLSVLDLEDKRIFSQDSQKMTAWFINIMIASQFEITTTCIFFKTFKLHNFCNTYQNYMKQSLKFRPMFLN
jgi:hypothetical protein